MTGENLLVPSNMLDFQCAQCGECCQNWLVSVDRDSLTRLQKVFNQEKLDKGILRKHFKRTPGKTDDYNYASIRMLNSRCGFLGEENCCGVHREFGAEYLPIVCRLFPRKIIVTPRGLEFSYSLSCGTAVKKLASSNPIKVLHNPDGFSFVKSHQYYGELTAKMFSQTPFREHYFALEEQFLELIQNRKYSLQERLIFLGLLISSLQKPCHKELDKESREILDAMLAGDTFYQQIQEIPPDIPYQLKALKLFLQCWSENNHDLSLSKVIEESFSFFHLQEEDISPESVKIYQNYYQQFFLPREQEVEHILENYLVNYILGKNFFIYRLNEAYYLMIFFYKIIRYLVLNLSLTEESLVSPETILKSIHLVERGIGHNRGYYGSVLKNLIKNGYTSVPHAIYLLKI